MSKPPVFIFGVPRSGTTLLRTLLDSHPAIACGPETPWLGGHQPRSVMEVWKFLREHEAGYCASYGMGKEVATEAARAMVSTLMDRYAAARGKTRWAEKTPDNVLHIGFLLEMFPEARVIHLTRDGLDVAVSTSVVAEHRRGISAFLEKNLSFGHCVPAVENNPLTALLRWSHWNRLVDEALSGREHLRIGYERLVAEPGPTMRQVMEFIGEPFEPSMLDYTRFGHEFPRWEWGSADVQARAGITKERVGRGRRELSPAQLAVLGPVAHGGDRLELTGDAKGSDPERDESLRLAAAYLDGFARPLGLGQPGGQASWDAAWLWLHGLSRIDWRGKRLVCLGNGRNGPAWAAALLGAEVVVVGAEGFPEASLKRLRDGLRVHIEWRKPEADRVPVDQADGLIGLRLGDGLEAGPDEFARVLRPGGLLAVSYEADGAEAQRHIARVEAGIAAALGGGVMTHRAASGTRLVGAALAVKGGGARG